MVVKEYSMLMFWALPALYFERLTLATLLPLDIVEKEPVTRCCKDSTMDYR